jgi:hypothetical protein
MAKVNVQIPGGSIEQYEASTVSELKQMLGGVSNHQATVNGEPQDDDFELSPFEFVVFTEKVKGA